MSFGRRRRINQLATRSPPSASSRTVLTRGSSTDDDDVIVDTAIAHLDLLIPLHHVFIGSSGPNPAGSSEWLDRRATRCPRGRQSPLVRLLPNDIESGSDYPVHPRNLSSAALTSSGWVHAMLCGPPSTGTSV